MLREHISRHRERVMAVLRGETPDIIPLFREAPMDVTAFSNLLPSLTGDRFRDELAFARFFDNASCAVGVPVRRSTRSRDQAHHCYEYETGAVWREDYTPTFCRTPIHFPVNTPDDTVHYTMIEACAPGRLDEAELARRIAAYQEAGYFVEGGVMGAWMGIYYYLTAFDNILMWMISEPMAAHTLFDMTSRFSLDSAAILLRNGVDAIFTASDLGSGNGLLFSRSMFREYVFPWLHKLAALCHAHDAILHLHSHGHIREIMDDIIEAGVDMINPIGPSDHNDLAIFKEHWGDRIVLNGGVSTCIADMNEPELRAHLEEVMRIGGIGGRFFPRTESGIPPMSAQKFWLYLEILRELREQGYTAAESSAASIEGRHV